MPRPKKRLITTYADLQNTLNEITKEVLNAVGEEIANILWNNVDTLWYSRPYNQEYSTRTNEIIDSITNAFPIKVNDKTYSVEVYFDETKIQPHASEQFFNQHMSLDGSTSYEGRAIGSWVIQWMEEGQRSPVHPYAGVHFFKKTVKKVGNEGSGAITAYLRDFILKEYRKHGIRIHPT